MKDPNVDYSILKKHHYKGTPEEAFYTCPICGNEYLDTFITAENNLYCQEIPCPPVFYSFLSVPDIFLFRVSIFWRYFCLLCASLTSC